MDGPPARLASATPQLIPWRSSPLVKPANERALYDSPAQTPRLACNVPRDLAHFRGLQTHGSKILIRLFGQAFISRRALAIYCLSALYPRNKQRMEHRPC